VLSVSQLVIGHYVDHFALDAPDSKSVLNPAMSLSLDLFEVYAFPKLIVVLWSLDGLGHVICLAR